MKNWLYFLYEVKLDIKFDKREEYLCRFMSAVMKGIM